MTGIYFLLPTLAGILAVAYVIVSLTLVREKPAEDQIFLHYTLQVRKFSLTFVRAEYLRIALSIIVFAVFLLLFKRGTSRIVAFSVVIGAAVTAAAGFLGTVAAASANRRTAASAKSSTSGALKCALRGGSVVGFSVVGFSLLMITFLLFVFGKVFGETPEALRAVTLPGLFGYTLGAGITALLGRTTGGIFAKSADMSADLSGKIEGGLEEDDSRNPAVIADAVGDTVNDITGLALDFSESYTGAVLGSMLIGAASGETVYIFLPLILAASAVFVSFLSFFCIRLPEPAQPGRVIMSSFIWVHLGILAAGLLSIRFMLPVGEVYHITGAYGAGILCGIIVSLLADYYTNSVKRPVLSIAGAAVQGTSSTTVQGLAVGWGSTLFPTLALVGTLFLSYRLADFYGVTVAALGLMSGAAVHAGIDAAGTIIDNAGIFSMLGMFPPSSRERTDKLDSVGNSFNAVGKGYAVSSAAFISVALFVVYKQVAGIEIIDLTEINVLAGIIIGGAFPYVFAAYLLKAVNEGFRKMLEETRELLNNGPSQDMYEKRALLIENGQKHAVGYIYRTGLMGLLLPAGVWLMGDKTMLGGIIIGTLVTGTLLALSVNHAGGGWDNAKKYIEAGAFGGKSSPAHHAIVIGDTIGDPLKDVVGPAMDIVMKLIPVTAIILVGV